MVHLRFAQKKKKPKYQETAACCLLGRDLFTKEGRKYFEWENSSDLFSRWWLHQCEGIR